MKNNQKDNSNFVFSVALSVILSFVVHYSLFSWINIHSSFHAMIGICIFFVLFILFNEAFRRLW